MSGRAVIAVIALAVALGGIVWWTGRTSDPVRTAGERALIPSAERVVHLDIESESGALSLARDPGTGAWIEEPDRPGEPDPAAIRRLLDGLAEHRIHRELPGADRDVVGATGRRLAFRTRDGEETGWSFGGLPPTGTGRYAVDDEGVVVLVDAGIVDRLDQAPERVWSRRPLAGIDADQVVGLRLSGPGRTPVTLARSDDVWRVVEPLDDRADPVGVRSAVRALVALTVPEILPGEVGDAVRLEAVVTTARGTTRLRFATRSDGEVAVGRVGADWHGSIAPASDAPWNRTPPGWRDPRVLVASVAAVAAVAHEGRGTVDLGLDLAGGEVREVGGARADLDADVARDVIERMFAMRTAGFLERDGITRVEGTWTFLDADGAVLARLEVGPRDPDGLRPARVSDRPGVWFLIEDEALGGPWSLERFARTGTAAS